MDFELELAKGKWIARCNVGSDECGDGLELPTLDINLQNVNMRMAYDDEEEDDEVMAKKKKKVFWFFYHLFS